MRATYEDSGSGKLTARMLQEMANQLPPQAEIVSMRVEESQMDGWYWSIKAVMPQVPTAQSFPHHKPGMRGSVADQVGQNRGGQRADHG